MGARANIFVVFLFILLVPKSAFAQVLISEIMYDLSEGSDSGREWVEVFNAYSSPVTLTEWRLYENEVNHRINEFSGGAVLSSGEYAIIADNPGKFLEDWPGYSGQIFDSAFSLKNDGELLGVRDGELIETDNIIYSSEQGAAGDGNTLQRESAGGNLFSASPPNPGVGDLSIIGGSYEVKETEEDSNSSNASEAVTNQMPYVAPTPSLYAYAGEDRDVIVGADTVFVARAVNTDGELIENNVRYIWNFGDGEIAEGERVIHAWKHPGRYALVLDVAYNKSAASDRIIVTAREAGIALSVDEEGNAVIQNKSKRDLDISFWHLQSLGLHFTIPENTFLLAGETVVLYSDTTALPASDEVALLYPNGTIAYTAHLNEEKIELVSEDTAVQEDARLLITESFTAEEADEYTPEVTPVFEEEIEGSSQVSSVAVVSTGIKDFVPSSPWVVGLLLMIGIGAIGAAAAKSASRDEYTIIEDTD